MSQERRSDPALGFALLVMSLGLSWRSSLGVYAALKKCSIFSPCTSVFQECK